MNKRSWVSLIFLSLLFLASWGSAFLQPTQPAMEKALMAPHWHHWFGTDSLGRDLFFRILEGSRISLAIGLITTFGAFFLGATVAALAHQSPRWLDDMIMRGVEILMALPSLVVMAVVILFFSNLIVERSQFDKILILSAALVSTSWFSMARQVRTLLEGESKKSYVESAHAIGCSHFRILWRHLLPNLTTPILILIGLQIPNHLLFESFLSFVGLGIQPPTASWGSLIQEGWKTLSSYPHLILMPSLVLFFTVLSFNMIFESVREHLDPRERKVF